ncbi:MAG: MBL fold metallo-hydrolase, partial [Treponema sp.]|nr:MBL fold metallo-hydrolase [Treponema sp.]
MDMPNTVQKIIELSDGFLYIPSTTNIGVIIDKKESVFDVYLIDSGNSELSGEYILDVLDEYFSEKKELYKIKAIINTHSHADHCGGNVYIKNITNCQIWSMKDERGSIENPILQTVIIWSGFTPKELQGLYFLPESSTPDKLIEDNEHIELSGNRSITFIDLPGHYFQTAG